MFWLNATEDAVGIKSSGRIFERIPTFAGVTLYPGLAYAGGGVMTLNQGITVNAISDGTSNTIMIDELRIGPDANDLRGTWALGQSGASISAGNGRTDSPGPNISNTGFDDVQSGSDRPEIGMGCTTGRSSQVTAKSRHTGGVQVGFCDGGVRFVHNSITQSAWFYLHSRNDGRSLGTDDY